MNHFKDIRVVLPLEVILKIFSFFDLIELIEISKIDPYFMKLAKKSYVEKVIKSRLIMEINLGTEQPINIRYECIKFDRINEQTLWKPTAIIGSKNRRSVNTKENVILRKIFFENEPRMSENDNFNLIHKVKGEMFIKDSGIECIKGEESLIELEKAIKKRNKRRNGKKLTFKIKKFKKDTKMVTNSNFDLPKEEIVHTELSPRGSITSCSSSSIYSNNCPSKLSLIKDGNEGLMLNNQCLFFYENNDLIRDTLRWSFEYKVETIKKSEDESWQKLKPSKLKLPIDIFFQNKLEESTNKKLKKHNYRIIVKKNLISILEKFSNSFVGVV